MINDDESRIVRLVANMRSGGPSLQAIATTLNTAGLKSKRARKFYPSTIRYMLDNPKYHGLSEYYFRHDVEMHCLTEGLHEAIIPRAA